MTTTADDLAARLGLQPFADYARAAEARHPTQRHGSTTRAVCEALDFIACQSMMRRCADVFRAEAEEREPAHIILGMTLTTDLQEPPR